MLYLSEDDSVCENYFVLRVHLCMSVNVSSEQTPVQKTSNKKGKIKDSFSRTCWW